jgi:hypothetical protein
MRVCLNTRQLNKKKIIFVSTKKLNMSIIKEVIASLGLQKSGICPSCSKNWTGLKNHVNKSKECSTKLLNDYLASKK